MTKLEAALEYAKKGWHVFPCVPGGKEPAVAGGFKTATTDKAQINWWWTKNPDYNIGIATGAVSNLVVLDIDDNEAFFGAYPFTIQALDNAYEVSTPSGGSHVYFLGQGYRSNAKRLTGADIRCEGGYVVAASSSIQGTPYEFVGGALQPTPRWLETMLDAARKEPLTSNEDEVQVIEGGRNDYLVRAAGSLRRKGLLTLNTLQAINQDQCVPPLDLDEVERIYNNVMTYDVAEPVEVEVIEEGPTILRAGELIDKMMSSLSDKTRIQGTPTGFKGLDALLGGGLRLGELVALCAIAKTGKSSLIHQIIHHLVAQNIPVGYASREMRPHDEVLPNMLSIQFELNMWKQEMTNEDKARYGDVVSQWPLYFTPGYGTFLLDKFVPWITQLKELGVEHFFVDHLHYCLEDPEEYKEAVRLIQALKALTNKLSINIFTIIQPTKLYEDQEIGLNSLRGGAGIGQAIDTLLTFKRYRDQFGQKKDNVSALRVSDIRHKLGRTGTIYLQYDPETTKMIEVKKESIVPDVKEDEEKSTNPLVKVIS